MHPHTIISIDTVTMQAESGLSKVKSGQRVFVLNIFNKLSETNPGLAVKQVEKLTGEFSVMSASTVHNVRTEFKTSGGLRTTGKRHQHKQRVDKNEVLVKTAVRRKVHGFFFKNELPTIDKVLQCVNSDNDLPNFSSSTLYRPYIFKCSVSRNI
jgi:hypothetical protein